MDSSIFFCEILILVSAGIDSFAEIICDQHQNDDLRLKCDLLKEYDKSIIPNNGTSAVNVDVIIHPQQFEVEESESKVTFTAWFNVTWRDQYLIWNPDNYNGLQSIHFDCSRIWYPSFSSITHKGYLRQKSNADFKCKALPNGIVSAIGVETINAFNSHADYALWPCDKQYFTVVFTGGFSKEYVKYNIKEISNQSLMNDNKWMLDRITCDDEYSQLTVRIALTRHHSVHTYTYINPSYVLTLMLLSSLWLDILSSDRLYLTGLIFLTQNIFLEYFMYILPTPTIEPPYIACFHKNLLLLNGVIIIWTIIARTIVKTNYENHKITMFVKWVTSKKYFEYLLIQSEVLQSDEMENDGLDSPHLLSSITKKREQWKICLQFADKVVCLVFSFSIALLMIAYHPVI